MNVEHALRSTRSMVATSDLSIAEQVTEIPVLTYIGLELRIIGKVADLAIENGQLFGTVIFSDTRIGKTCREMFLTNKNEPLLSIGIHGVLLQFV